MFQDNFKKINRALSELIAFVQWVSDNSDWKCSVVVDNLSLKLASVQKERKIAHTRLVFNKNSWETLEIMD